MADENQWQFLGSADLSGGVGDDVSVDFTDNEKIIIQFLSFFEASGSILQQVKIDGNTGTNYAQRQSDNGDAGSTFTSRSIFDNIAVGGKTGFMYADYLNVSGQTKLMWLHEIEIGTAGATTAPSRNQYVGKFTLGTGQTDTIDVHNAGGGDLGTDTDLQVAGAD